MSEQLKSILDEMTKNGWIAYDQEHDIYRLGPAAVEYLEGAPDPVVSVFLRSLT